MAKVMLDFKLQIGHDAPPLIAIKTKRESETELQTDVY